MSETVTEQKQTGKTFYAWTEILLSAEIEKDSKVIASRKYHKVGDQIKPSDLPGGQKEFDNLVEIGVIRDSPMPHTRMDQSPKQAVIAEAKEKIEKINKGVGRTVAGR